MESTTTVAKPNTPRLHPLVAAAAIALILVSLIGVAAMTGLLPSSSSANSPQQLAALDKNAAQQVAPATQAIPETSPARSSAATTHQAQVQPTAPAICASCGEVVAVRAVQHTPSTSGVGIAGGAVVGGLLGNQVGGGTGRTLATIAGAVGGGYAGNEIEKRSRTTTSYMVDVRMENGKTRSFPQSAENWRVGDRVRVINGRLEGRG